MYEHLIKSACIHFVHIRASRHIQRYVGATYFFQLIKCSSCDYEAFCLSELKAHEEKHLPDLPTSCDQCGETFANQRCVRALMSVQAHMYMVVYKTIARLGSKHQV